MTTQTHDDVKYVYWIDPERFDALRPDLANAGMEALPVDKTACQTLLAKGAVVRYAPPEVWSGMCNRQGSWYRASSLSGKCLVVSNVRLPASFDAHLDTELRPSDFQPESLPSPEDLQALVDSPEYQEAKPPGWEDTKFKDQFMTKLLFTVTGFWGWGDNLRSKFLGHRANHANFLAHHFTTEIDGERVAYSVTDNAGVCSSCAEFFNVVGSSDRKLVRSCPGSVVFAKMERSTYYDIVPLRRRAG